MAKGDDIEERLVDFAVNVIALCDTLPDRRAGDHLAGQLLRSGTSPAAHYLQLSIHNSSLKERHG